MSNIGHQKRYKWSPLYSLVSPSENRPMTLYIHAENQKLLWNIMNKLPLITDFFEPYPQEHKEQWFKSVIQLFYDKYKTRRLQLNDLHQLNQETIAYIVQTIREKTQAQPQYTQPQYTQPQYTPSSPDNIENRQERVDKKQDQIHQQFTARQNEYTSMFNKPTPPEVNFRETEADTAISNMDELIRQHMAQREFEMKQYSPPPPVSQPPSTPIVEPRPVNIQHEILEQESAPMKSVSRKPSNEVIVASKHYEECLRMQSEEIAYLKSVVSSLSSTIETICKEMIHIKQYVDVSSSEQFMLSQHG
jgi:hypothetical protein